MAALLPAAWLTGDPLRIFEREQAERGARHAHEPQERMTSEMRAVERGRQTRQTGHTYNRTIGARPVY
eukprot:scaffold81986_cov27-Tisochrysis_lutea.AAC.1